MQTLRIRLRAGWLSTLGFAAIGFASACSSTTEEPPPPAAVTGEAEVTGLRSLASGLVAPMDSTPDPEGNRVVFTAMGGARLSDDKFDAAAQGVVMATNKNGAAPSMLASGFVAPVQVVMSIDGNTTFVADAAVELRAPGSIDEAEVGVVYAVPTSGGNKTELASTRGFRPLGLDVAEVDGNEWLYMVGVDPADGKPGVFRTKPSGGSLETVIKSDSFHSPQCVAVASNGDLYITDGGGSLRQGSVLKVSGGNVTVVADNVNMATPAGLALSESGNYLLVSTLRSPDQGSSAAVLRIELATNTVGVFDDGISMNHGSAGIHRSHKADSFTWADSGGTVYLVGTKKNPLP